MASGEHQYRIGVEWIGNQGSGTSGYRDYGRNHEIRANGKPTIPGSADPAFRGDAARWNPEDLLVAAASACHKLWYLHLCAEAGVVVERYADDAIGTMIDTAQEGRFTRILLRPHVTIRAGGNAGLAAELHHEAHARCYVANSVNFPIDCEPHIDVLPG
ncbi:OsmC family protein [Pandoraea apista]|uniref:Peroxiredoxin n=1 Tax=Pandoraea apista TaxID=93218 RepID=A0A0B5F7T6_9BURK|nr:OsmC family protein [Pandoraea apista]AJF00270.1 peroxiredoxin [Pandoraea apista]AKH74436.1 peroxiredoxin [Pandoraea apista]AKI62986.1 peroxiredoxin [Pandoraea apista]ALS64656.1 peroxiredoxin [Pandoraea apista]AVF41239.1 peroxiredoxin [Pandoraea apista]